MFVAYSRDKVYKDIGTTRQLFIDDDIVAVVKNVTRRQHTPKKHPASPVYKNDRPWEVVTYFRNSNFSVIHDPADGLFKCWVQDFHDYFTVPGVPFERSRIYYAQSEDGVNWEKPALGKHSVDGRDTNTIIVSPDHTGFVHHLPQHDPRSGRNGPIPPVQDGAPSDNGRPEAGIVPVVFTQRHRLDAIRRKSNHSRVDG